MIISATYLAPRIGFDGSCGGVELDGLLFLFGTFFHLLHQEVHLGREHVNLMNGVHTSLLSLEALFVPSLVDHHLFDEVLGILHIVLKECSSSGSIQVTMGHTSQPMVETLD